MTVGEYLEGKLGGKRELNKLVDAMYTRCVKEVSNGNTKKEAGPPVARS